jgi:arylsulfatase A-like enzyme
MADVFRKAGYATGIVGKWHLGMEEEFHPLERGFDEFFGFRHGGHAYFEAKARKRNRDPLMRGREAVEEKEYLTDAFGREAADFVRRHAKEPWFLYLSFNAVHTPMQAKPEDEKRFAAIEDGKRRTYAGMLFAMDRAVGTVLAEVEKQGLAKDTLVVFLGDNGGPTSTTTSRNAPLRGEKGQLYEGGIRVPFLMRLDGRIPAGKVVSHPVSSLDVLPTALAAAGIAPGKDARRDGVDLLPLLTGKTEEAPHEALFFRTGNQSAVRWGRWKLVTRRGVTELFDLAHDVGESFDFLESEPDVAAKMRALYAEWEKGTVPAKWIRGSSRRGER